MTGLNLEPSKVALGRITASFGAITTVAPLSTACGLLRFAQNDKMFCSMTNELL